MTLKDCCETVNWSDSKIKSLTWFDTSRNILSDKRKAGQVGDCNEKP
jgi:hypothetical protein